MKGSAILILLLPTLALAEDPSGISPVVDTTPAPQAVKTPAAKKKGKRFREKEAEGSEAADRFEADTVIKSKYEHNGQPLEVDPD
jgi:hypothetical protein